jgi:hypothetical protein
MVDRLGNVVHKGDAVRYWHKVDGKATPEIGEVVRIYVFAKRQEVSIERKHYNNTNISFRTESGITKITKAEAVIWKFEQFSFDGDGF